MPGSGSGEGRAALSGRGPHQVPAPSQASSSAVPLRQGRRAHAQTQGAGRRPPPQPRPLPRPERLRVSSEAASASRAPGRNAGPSFPRCSEVSCHGPVPPTESRAKQHVALVTAMAGTGESLERFFTGYYGTCVRRFAARQEPHTLFLL